MSQDTVAHDPESIARRRAENLARTLERCARGHPWYRARLARAGLRFEDFRTLDDFERFPLTTKADFMADPEAFRLDLPDLPPIERTLWDLAYTTGTTTGRPSPFYNTTYDVFSLMAVSIRQFELGGIGPGDRIANAYPLTLYPHGAFLRTIFGAAALGAAQVSTFPGTPDGTFTLHRSTDEGVAIIERERATVLCGVPSYIRHLLARARELGADFSAVRVCSMTGEPLTPGLRADLRARFAALGARQVFLQSRLGLTEMQGALIECQEEAGLHNPAPDQFLIEVVDRATGRRLPDGEDGYLAVTHLDRRGTVLLRYVTGDVTAMAHDRCPACGRTGERVLHLPTRDSELVKIKGMLVNLAALKDQLAAEPGLADFQLVIEKEDPADPYARDVLRLRYVVAAGDTAGLEQHLGRLVGEGTGVRPRLERVGSVGELFGSGTFKGARVVDRRSTGAGRPA